MFPPVLISLSGYAAIFTLTVIPSAISSIFSKKILHGLTIYDIIAPNFPSIQEL
jgi:hypothetical protein